MASEVAAKPVSPKTERSCPGCGERKPVTQFPLMPNDWRCMDCIPDEVYEIKQLRRMEKAQREFASLIDATGVTVSKVPRLSDLLSGIYREFGGANMFCHDLVQGITRAENLAAQKGQPPPKWCTDARLAIAKLTVQEDKLQQRIDETRMNDRQLQAQERLKALEVMMEMAKEKELGVPLARMLKIAGLDIDEATIDQFAASQVTKDEALAIAQQEATVNAS